MKLRTLTEQAPTLFKTKISVQLLGPPGCGKSETIENAVPEAICNSMGIPREDFKVLTRALTSMEAPDIGGFRVPAKNDASEMVTAVTIPDMIAEMDTPYGILFLDELSQAAMDVQKAVAPLILDGRMGNYQIPDGWVVWAASNRMSDRAGTVRPPMHLINRRLDISISEDVDGWTQWAANRGMHPLFIAFARYKPAAVFSQSVPTEPVPYSTARSYTRWHDLVMEHTGGNIGAALESDLLAMEYGIGMVGKGCAAEACAFMKVANDLPTYEEIVADPVGTAKALPKGRYDVLHSAAAMLAHHIDHKHVSQAFKFIEQLPKEFQVATVNQCAAQKKGAILNSPEFVKFVTNNSTIVLASQGLT